MTSAKKIKNIFYLGIFFGIFALLLPFIAKSLDIHIGSVMFPLGLVIIGGSFLFNFFASRKIEKNNIYWWQDLVAFFFILEGISIFLNIHQKIVNIGFETQLYKLIFWLLIISGVIKYIFVSVQDGFHEYKKEQAGINNASVYYQRAHMYANKQMYDKAIEFYSMALDEKGLADYKIYNDRGMAYYKKESIDRAIEDYSEAIKLNSNIGEIYFNRGLAYVANNSKDKALIDFDKTIAIDKGLIDAFLERASIYEELNKNKEAIENYRQYIEKAPPNFDENIAYAKERIEVLEHKDLG